MKSIKIYNERQKIDEGFEKGNRREIETERPIINPAPQKPNKEEK